MEAVTIVCTEGQSCRPAIIGIWVDGNVPDLDNALIEMPVQRAPGAAILQTLRKGSGLSVVTRKGTRRLRISQTFDLPTGVYCFGIRISVGDFDETPIKGSLAILPKGTPT